MGLKLYRHNKQSKYTDMVIIGKSYPGRFGHSPQNITGCIIGINQNEREYPIGFYSQSFYGFQEIEEDLLLKSDENLFTNGKDVIIKCDLHNKRGYISSNFSPHIEYVRITSDEVIKTSANLLNKDTLWVDGKNASWFKKVKSVKFQSK